MEINEATEYSYRPDTPAGVVAHIRHVFESMKVCGVNATDVRALIELGIPAINLMMKNTKPEDLEKWCLDWAADTFKDSEI
jgi:hypothetical protein